MVSTRAGGRSTGPYARFNLSRGVGDDPRAVAANRRRLVAELGVRAAVFLDQVHGTRVAVLDAPGAVPAPDAPDVPGTDAAVTHLPGVALAVLAADCVPVLLADPVAGVVGAAHAGRVGAAAGVVEATLTAMLGRGAALDRTEVLLGPAVCGACYEVPAALRDEVDAALPGSATRTRRGTPGLDLRAGLRERLAALGVARVGVDPRCTAEDRDLYSHRRATHAARTARAGGPGRTDPAAPARTGRHAAVTWLDPTP